MESVSHSNITGCEKFLQQDRECVTSGEPNFAVSTVTELSQYSC